METSIPPSLLAALKKQKYHLIGKHSAVKRCRWFHETLIHDRPCYKQKFYGIKTHQCIQMTPALYYCTQRCLFCWRAQNSDLQITWDETRLPTSDSPDEIVEGCIKVQHKLLTGYNGNPRVNRQKLKEASIPKHVAISLTGEPTLYTRLGELISAFHCRGFTTFLVTNGTVPSSLSSLNEEPTQLYLSVCAPDGETFRKVCRPQVPKAWEKLKETLDLLSSFRSPTVIRITLARNLNMNDVDGYAKLMKNANPTYVEPKAYMHVGFSRLRLGYENMPSHLEVREFGTRLAAEMSYSIIDESEDSRVVLLSGRGKSLRFGDG